MADREYADVILTALAWDEGKRALRDASRMRIEQERAQNPVKTMTRARTVRGFTTGAITNSGELVTFVGMPEEVDWDALFRANKRLLLGFELGDGGKRYNAVGLKITNISIEGEADGGVERTISFVFEDLEPQPGSGPGL